VPLQCLWRDSVTLISTLLLTYLLTPLVLSTKWCRCSLLITIIVCCVDDDSQTGGGSSSFFLAIVLFDMLSCSSVAISWHCSLPEPWYHLWQIGWCIVKCKCKIIRFSTEVFRGVRRLMWRDEFSAELSTVYDWWMMIGAVMEARSMRLGLQRGNSVGRAVFLSKGLACRGVLPNEDLPDQKWRWLGCRRCWSRQDSAHGHSQMQRLLFSAVLARDGMKYSVDHWLSYYFLD